MTKFLHATRYLTPRAKAWGLDTFIRDELPGCDLQETLNFYHDFKQWSIDPEDSGFLAANDRYFLLTQACHRKDAIHPWLFDRCREVEAEPDGVLDLWSRFHYKALALDTQLLTPQGWMQHGDLKVGNFVYGPDGKETQVLAVTPVFFGADCFEVLFDDGERIVASGDHLWTDIDGHTVATSAIASMQHPFKTALCQPIGEMLLPSDWPRRDQFINEGMKALGPRGCPANKAIVGWLSRMGLKVTIKDGWVTAISTTHRAIVAVNPVAVVPCSCIQVARPDGLYLVGEHCVTTHNSTIITFAGSLQEIIRDPEITICIFSYNATIARKFLTQIKNEIERNEDLRLACPDVFWVDPRRDSENWSIGGGLTMIRKSNPKEATIEAHGLDSQPTSKHFALLIYDDVVVKKSVSNAAQVEKTTENWELSDNIGIGSSTRKWMPGTRYDLADTYATLIERKLFKVRMYPATHNGRLDGRPVFMTQAHWDKVKTTQRRTVAAQMLQNPAAGGDQMFELEWLKPWEIRPGRLNIYILVDPASSMKKESDRTAMAVVGVDERGNKYFVDGMCHRMTLLDRWKNLLALHKKWSKMPSVELVKVGYEKYGAQADIEAMQQRMQDFGYEFQIEPLNWPRSGEHSKKDRVGRLQPDIQGSEYRFYFPAVVWRPHAGNDSAGGMCFWSYQNDTHQLVYRPAEKITVKGQNDKGEDIYNWSGEPLLTRQMQMVTSQGEPFRVAKAIVRKDEEGELYDATSRLFEEMMVFPKRRGHDDFVDALSRIYDIGYTQPMKSSDKNKIEGPGPAH